MFKTKTIQGIEITSAQMAARWGAKLVNRLGRVLGPAIGPVAMSLAHSGEAGLAGIDVATLGPALSDVFAKLDDAEADSLMVAIFRGSRARVGDMFVELDSVEAIDQVFGSNIKALYLALWFALEVSFADFFGAASTTLARPAGAAASG